MVLNIGTERREELAEDRTIWRNVFRKRGEALVIRITEIRITCDKNN